MISKKKIYRQRNGDTVDKWSATEKELKRRSICRQDPLILRRNLCRDQVRTRKMKETNWYRYFKERLRRNNVTAKELKESEMGQKKKKRWGKSEKEEIFWRVVLKYFKCTIYWRNWRATEDGSPHENSDLFCVFMAMVAKRRHFRKFVTTLVGRPIHWNYRRKKSGRADLVICISQSHFMIAYRGIARRART